MKEKIRFKLNLFDTVIILLAVIVAAVLLWNRLAPKSDGGAVAPTQQTIEYTIRLRGAMEGTGALVQPGDVLEDAIKNYSIGTVVSVTIGPAKTAAIDEANRVLRQAETPEREDIDIVITARATENEAQILVDGGFEVRVGEPAWVRGPGYLGSGTIINIAREQEG